MRHAAPELLAHAVDLRLDGVAIDPALSSTVQDIVLTESLCRPASLRMSVHDPDGDWQRRVVARSPSVEFGIRDDGANRASRSLFSGAVARVDAELSPRESLTIRLVAFDALHGLSRTYRHRSFPAATDGELVRTLAREHGLRVVSDRSGVSMGHVMQDGESDLSLLRRVCERSGRDFLVRDGVLHLWSLPAPGVEPIVLEWGGTLERASVEAERVGVPDRIVLRDRDVVAATTLEIASTVDDLATSPASERGVTHEDAAQGSAESLEFMARARQERARRRAERFEGLARGDVALRAGTCVRVASAGAPIDGEWCLDRVEHRFGANSGWTTALFGFRA